MDTTPTTDAFDPQALADEHFAPLPIDAGRTEEAHARRLADRYRLEFLDMGLFRIDQELFRGIPADLMLRYGFVPYRRDGRVLIIVVSDPTDLPMIDELAVLLGAPVRVMVGARTAIESILKKSESSQRVLDDATEDFIQVLKDEDSSEDLTVERLTSDHSPIIRMVDAMVFTAIQRRASDIHIETQDDAVVVKYRIDGVLQPASRPIAKALAQRDHLAHQGDGRARHRREAGAAGRPLPAAGPRQDHRLPRLDHAERARRGRGHPHPRQAVDQRAVHRAAARHPRLPGARAEALPQVHPRALRHGAGHRADRLGQDHHPLRRAGRDPSIEDKIITIEDPVEYQLKGITQIPINEKKGLTFARGLRSILRHDPDKIMVGEIRDPETAQIAIQSALTGHLVFTTVHANNVFDVLRPLPQHGRRAVPVHLGAQLRDGAAAGPQDLRELPPVGAHSGRAAGRVGDGPGAGRHATPSTEGAGCVECGGTGFKGRMAICELLDLTDHIRELILERRPISEIKRAAKEQGMRFLRESAVDRVMLGLTTLREINKVTFVE